MRITIENLWLPALFAVLLGTGLLVRIVRLKTWLAFILSPLKALIPLVYFANFYDGSWNLLDDLTYFKKGDALLGTGYNPFLIFFTSDGRNVLFATVGDRTVIYPWWNMLAIYVFGPFYSSPIFLNVATTFVSAAVLFKMARLSGCSEKYSKWLCIFCLIQWDILAWSSFVDVKDTLVMMLTLLTLYCAILVVRSRKIGHAVLLACIASTFWWIRFYIPVLMLISFAIWIVFAVKGLKKLPWIVFAASVFYFVLPEGAFELLQEYYNQDLILGPLKMALTPQPWSIDPVYSFLLIPSILHWILFVPAVFAGAVMFRKNRVFRFAAIYFLVLIVFYGVIPQLYGSRERQQVAWVLVWAQFHFLWNALQASPVSAKRLVEGRVPRGIEHVPDFTPHYRSQHGRR